LVLMMTGVSAVEIKQRFPADEPAGSMRTQWRVIWDIERHGGQSEVLVIREAFFKRTPMEPEIKVLDDSRLAEIFVPYNDGTRIYDISLFSFDLVTLQESALGPPCIAEGRLFERDGDEADSGLVAAEVHDGQIRWMNAADEIRRGQSLALWSVLDGANYRYIMLYKFRDDGVIEFQLGATAHNLKNTGSDSATHLHMGCWRVNVDLGDAAQTKTSVVRFDTAALATEVDDLNEETRLKWNPEEYTRLRVTSTFAQNSHNPAHPISYELTPLRMGSGRYHGIGEEFTQNDLWVTRRDASELRPRDLDDITDGEPIGTQPVTLWHHASVLHVPRDEDFGVNGTNPGDGVAITAWAGFELKPRNFFSSTPLYP
jgi:hypothetical protein